MSVELVKQEPIELEAPSNKELQPDPKPPTTPSLGPPPNGGLTAWLQVFGSFLIAMNNWGIINSVGVYQAFYERNFLKTYSPSDIAWIGTMQGFLLLCLGVVSGKLYDRGYLRLLLYAGGFFIVFGMLMLSVSTEYYQIFLAQGVAVGLGQALTFTPSLSIVPPYFTTKRAFAMALASSGGSFGGVIYPLIFRRLEPSIGFGWATRVIALVALATMLGSTFLLKPRVPIKQNKSRNLIDPTALKEVPFMAYVACAFFLWAGLYVPIFLVPTYAEVTLGSPPSFSLSLPSILNGASFLGRLISGFLADRLGPFQVFNASEAILVVLSLCWIAVSSNAGIVVLITFMGLAYGTVLTLPATCVFMMSPNLGKLGSRVGMSLFPAGIAILVTGPIAAATISENSSMPFLGPQLWTALTIAAAFVMSMISLYWVVVRKHYAAQA